MAIDKPKQAKINWEKKTSWSKTEQVGYNQCVNDYDAYHKQEMDKKDAYIKTLEDMNSQKNGEIKELVENIDRLADEEKMREIIKVSMIRYNDYIVNESDMDIISEEITEAICKYIKGE